MEREYMEYDVVIVGAGPSGLAAACRIRQLSQASGQDVSVCVVEKGSEVGAHILSGAILDPRALTELFPNWKELGAPLNAPVSSDEVYFMASDVSAIKIPNALLLSAMHNHGNYAVSLGNVCRWLAEQAIALGAEIYPGFPAADILFDEKNQIVKGIITGDMGVSADGSHTDNYTPGMELRGKYTIFSEGCRGHLGKRLMEKYQLQKNSGTQHYGIGIKELWEIDPAKADLGKVIHSFGWPLSESNSTGGGFLYHLENNQVTLGLITDLAYTNPHVSPFDEMQRFKQHPAIKKYLEGGKRISYGARAINKGGYQAVPKLSFPGGLLSGCNAGFMNFARIKGSHTAIKTGMLAAETIFDALKNEDEGGKDLVEMDVRYKNSWVYEELYTVRNVAPAMHKFGALGGALFAFIDQNIFQGKLPLTLQDARPDHEGLLLAKDCKKINYPKPDGVISFDKLSSVFLSNTNHEEHQPCHLTLKDKSVPIQHNLPLYDEPAQRYCPAGVYEVITKEDGENIFQINAQNCVHCKTCDIKDPTQNIIWVTPEGGGGPNYPNM